MFEQVKTLPVCIMSFNRPHYFSQVVKSLSNQVNAGNIEYHLFQDNAVSSITKNRYAKDEDIAECIRLFKSKFPNSKVHLANRNLGVALNYERAMKYVFEECDFEYAVCVEDDVILNDNYMQIMRILLEQFKNESKIGMVSAKGINPTTPMRIQDKDCGKLKPFGAFISTGWWKHKWLKIKPVFDEYLDIVRKNDYRLRDKRQIIDFYKSKGINCTEQNLVSSQDRAKEIAMLMNNQIFLSTVTNNLRYIGEIGIHGTREFFIKSGFDRTIVYNKKIENFENIDDKQLTKYILDWRAKHFCK